MPLYEFHCSNCRKDFELLVRKQADLDQAACPECGTKKVKKIFSVFGVADGSKDQGGDLGDCGSCGAGSCPSRR